MRDTGRRTRTPAPSAVRTPGNADERAGREASAGNRRREGIDHEGIDHEGRGHG